MSCPSRRVSSSSRATKLSWCRKVSTTSMASISSSSFCGGGAGEPAAGAGADSSSVVAGAASAIERQGLTLRHKAGDAALAPLHGIADFGRVLGGELAHLVDDLERALLERDHRVHEAFHRIGPDRRAVAGPHGLFADLIADFS